MSQTKKMVVYAYFVGFMISAAYLSALLPLLNLLLVPFIFYYVIHSKLKSNSLLMLFFITIQLLVSSRSLIVFVYTIYDNGLLFLYVLLINLFKPICRNMTTILFTYYFITTSLLTIILFIAFFSIGFYLTPAIILSHLFIELRLFILGLLFLYAIILIIVARKINYCIKRVERHFKSFSVQ